MRREHARTCAYVRRHTPPDPHRLKHARIRAYAMGASLENIYSFHTGFIHPVTILMPRSTNERHHMRHPATNITPRETLFPTTDRDVLPIHVDSAARDWLTDLAWADEDTAHEMIATCDPLALVASVTRHYDGSWNDFLIAEGEIDPR